MKQLWNKLVKKNSKYFINSDHGKGITEEEFIKSGRKDFLDLVWNDPLLKDNLFNPFLEIGCGTGRILEHARIWKYTILGIDISGEMIKQARKRCPTIYFAETDGYTIPFADNSIGLVFSYLVFQHMKTKEMVESNLKEAFRVLKPGGIFKVRLRTDRINDKMHKWWAGVHYNQEEAIKISEKIGFEIIKTQQVEDYGLWVWLKKPLLHLT